MADNKTKSGVLATVNERADMKTLIFVCLLLALGSVSTVVAQQDATELFAEIQQRYSADGLPTALRSPISIEQAESFVAAIRFFREAAASDLPKVTAADIGDNRRLKSDQQRMANWLRNEVPRRLDFAVQTTRQGLEGIVNGRTPFIRFGAEIDMENQNQVRNNLANPETVAQREDAIRETLTAIDLMARIDELSGGSTDWSGKRAEVQALADRFRANVAAAEKLIVPPKDINDAQLRSVAESTLKNPKYGVKAWQRLIVNSRKQQRRFSNYEISGSTIYRVDYDFDHFQATTIEEEGGQLYLFHNTLAFYRSGATTTPLNQWVVRERFRGPRIAAENIDK